MKLNELDAEIAKILGCATTPVPDYSSNWTHTGMLMERLPAPIINRLYGDSWQVQIGGKDVRTMQTITHNSLQVAVCLAFVKVFGKEKP